MLAALACQQARDLVDPEEIEAELKREPGRAGKVGGLVGVTLQQHASRITRAIAEAPDARCVWGAHADTRWIGELAIERHRGGTLVSRWTETRTLDQRATAVAMRYSATFRTEIGTSGTREAEWRITPEGTFLAAPGTDGDLWIRRDTEEDERRRVLAASEGMLQSLLDAVGGWKRDGDGWTPGDEALRCAKLTEGEAFTARFTASAQVQSAALRVEDDARHFTATWLLSDGSTVEASFDDRIAPLEADIAPPPDDRLVPIARDRSLARAQQLLAKLATSGLAEVASPPAPEPSTDQQ